MPNLKDPPEVMRNTVPRGDLRAYPSDENLSKLSQRDSKLGDNRASKPKKVGAGAEKQRIVCGFTQKNIENSEVYPTGTRFVENSVYLIYALYILVSEVLLPAGGGGGAVDAA